MNDYQKHKLFWIPAALTALLVTGCASGEDAPVEDKNSGPATLILFPGGYGNVATKCGAPGLRVFVGEDDVKASSSLAVIADSSCK